MYWYTCNLSPSKRPILECSHSCLGDCAQNDNVCCRAAMATRELRSENSCLKVCEELRRQNTEGFFVSRTLCLGRCLLSHVLCSFQNIKRRQTSCCCYLYTSCTCSHSRLIESAWTGLNTGSYIMNGREVALFWTWIGTKCVDM